MTDKKTGKELIPKSISSLEKPIRDLVSRGLNLTSRLETKNLEITKIDLSSHFAKKIICVQSAKRAVGKTSIVANIAAQVAMSGARVGVVDTDMQSPGIHVLFGMNGDKMGKTLNQFLRGECSIEEVAMPIGENDSDEPGHKKLLGKDLWLIPPSISGSEISKIKRNSYDPNLLNEGVQRLVDVLDLNYLFIDTRTGIAEETLLLSAISDALILVLKPDEQDFQGTAVTIDIARMLDVPNLVLVVNKVLTRYDFNQVRAEFEKTFGVNVAGVMPLSYDLVELGSKDIFSLHTPDHAWSKAIKDIAETVLSIK